MRMVSSALAAVLLASCEGPIVAPPGPLNGNNDGAASDAAVVPFVPFMPRGPGGPSGAAGIGGMPGGSGGIDGSAGRGGADGGVPAAGMLVKEGSLSFLDLNFTASGMSGDCRRIIGSDYNGGFSPGYVWTDGGANPSPIISLGHLAPDLVSTLP